MSKKKKIDTSNTKVSENKEEDFFQKYIENQFTQKPSLPNNQVKKTTLSVVTEHKKYYFA